ncbi:hypothetical protein CIK05_02875 [Bdellovibrio sp. qaytius]|nr:hypothetical protein CIK05_02875 [Bdellovibrio sp. qaytius]
MNIKNLAGNAIINSLPAIKGANATEKTIKSESSHDRDANGQAQYQKNKKKEKMSREQAEKAVANLNAKQFMTDMSWVAVLIDDNGFFYAEVKDQSENVIRKIAEFDLWEMLEASTSENSPKGNLLKRTA